MPSRSAWLTFVSACVFLTGCGGSSNSAGTPSQNGSTPSTPSPTQPSPPAATAPTTPTGLTASATAGQVSLSWSAVSGSPTYTVKRSVVTSGPYTAIKSGLAETSFTDTGLANSTTYYYVVSASNSVGESTNSTQASATTPAPQGSTASCTPDIAIPSAGGNTWPNSCTAGASSTLATLVDVQGDITLDQQGQVYQNKRVDGSITVTACDVKIENVEVDAGVPYTGDNTPDVFPIWLKQPANCGVTLDHVSVITKPAPNVYVTNAIRVAYGGPVTITSSKIIGAQLGILTGPGTIKDNYAVLGPNMRGDHNEVIIEDGTSNLTIEHNTFLNPNLQTSVLSLFTEDGANSDFLVDNNLMAGGGYTCYCGDGASDNNGNPARASNVSFVNNVFWRFYYPDVGNFGPGRAYNPAGGGQWTNNLYMNADGTLTTEQVPQPPIDQP